MEMFLQRRTLFLSCLNNFVTFLKWKAKVGLHSLGDVT